MYTILQVIYEGVTITIYKEDGLYANDPNLGYTTMEYALEEAKEEVDKTLN